MPTIVQAVEKDKNFSNIKGRKRLNDRESALLNAAYVVAEAELSKLKIKYEKKSGDHRVEQERTKTATIATMARIEGFGKFLTTPYLEYFPDKEKLSEDIIIEGECNLTPNDSSGNPVENRTQSSSPMYSKSHNGVAESLPGWSKPVILFIEHTFARMTPLTTALWFMIFVAAAIGLGWAQKSYLESNYDFMAKENLRLKEEATKHSGNFEKYSLLEAESDKKNKIISGLKADNANLNGVNIKIKEENSYQSSKFQNELLELQQQQQIAISKFQENTDAATKSQISALTEAKLRLEAENSIQNENYIKLKTKNESLLIETSDNKVLIGNQEKSITDLNNSAIQQQSQIRALQNVRSQKNTLVAFTNSILELVNEVLYEPRYLRTNPYERKDDFTKGFKKLRSPLRDTLDQLVIRKTM